MCFDKIRRLPKKLPKTAYKIFTRSLASMGKELTFPIYGGGEVLEEGKWYRDEVLMTLPVRHSDKTYSAGFHVFPTRRDAITWLGTTSSLIHEIRKVEVKDYLAAGSYNYSSRDVPAFTVRKFKIIDDN